MTIGIEILILSVSTSMLSGPGINAKSIDAPINDNNNCISIN